jgi:hypothetical protein
MLTGIDINYGYRYKLCQKVFSKKKKATENKVPQDVAANELKAVF